MLIGPFFLAVAQSATVDLNVGAYFEFNTTNRGWNSAGVWPAVHLAAEHVNQRNDLLPGYRLKLHRKDSRVCTNVSPTNITGLNLFGTGNLVMWG